MASNYRRIQINIEGLETGPFTIARNLMDMKDGVLTTTSETFKVKEYRLEWDNIYV